MITSPAEYSLSKKNILILSLITAFTMVWGMWRWGGMYYNWIIALPFIVIGIYLYIFYIYAFSLLIVGCLPFSMQFEKILNGLSISIPAEPAIALLMLVFIWKFISDIRTEPKVFTHPFSVLLMGYILWNVFTMFTSQLPVVSFKFVLMRIAYVVVFYFYFLDVFIKREKSILSFLYITLFSVCGIIVYTLINKLNSMSFQDMYYECRPFYVDHTIYSAAVAMLFPFAVAVLFSSFSITKNTRWTGFFLLVLMLYTLGIYYSFSRAAWASLLAASGLYLFIRLRGNFLLLCILVFSVSAGIYFSSDMLMKKFSENKTVSQQDVSGHVESITNVTTDVSNKERINRWLCALRMFEDRPVLGFGPGTYQFVYAPYQRSKEMTRISSTTGERGESHSEYLKPLSESGLPGFVIQILLVLFSFYYGLKVIYNTADKKKKLLAITVLLGLTTYFIHGLVNFFLDTDKMAALFFGFMAILVATDISTIYETPENVQG